MTVAVAARVTAMDAAVAARMALALALVVVAVAVAVVVAAVALALTAELARQAARLMARPNSQGRYRVQGRRLPWTWGWSSYSQIGVRDSQALLKLYSPTLLPCCPVLLPSCLPTLLPSYPLRFLPGGVGQLPPDFWGGRDEQDTLCLDGTIWAPRKKQSDAKDYVDHNACLRAAFQTDWMATSGANQSNGRSFGSKVVTPEALAAVLAYPQPVLSSLASCL